MARKKISTFGVRLRHFRELAKLSQVQLAALAGTSNSAICMIESGSRGASGQLVYRLACALQVPVGEFYDPISAPDKSPEKIDNRP